MSTSIFLLALFIFAGSKISAQKEVLLTRKNMFGEKRMSVPMFTKVAYKFRPLTFYRKAELVDANDSVAIFKGGMTMPWTDFYALRLSRNRHLLESFSIFFKRFGLIFFPLNTVNQLITGNQPVLSPLAGAISAGLLATGLVMREGTFKRFRRGKNLEIKIIDKSFEKLNESTH